MRCAICDELINKRKKGKENAVSQKGHIQTRFERQRHSKSKLLIAILMTSVHLYGQLVKEHEKAQRSKNKPFLDRMAAYTHI